MVDNLFNNFQIHFPRFADKTVSYYRESPFELVVKLTDGDIIMYDDLNGSIRFLPRDNDNMTEAQCKKEFGLRLKRLMFVKGVTQEDITRKTGITQPMLSRYMNGENVPSFYKVDQIARVLGCSVDEFRCVLK